MTQAWQRMQKREARIIAKDEINEMNSWLKRARWHRYLIELNWEKLSQSIARDNSSKNLKIIERREHHRSSSYRIIVLLIFDESNCSSRNNKIYIDYRDLLTRCNNDTKRDENINDATISFHIFESSNFLKQSSIESYDLDRQKSLVRVLYLWKFKSSFAIIDWRLKTRACHVLMIQILSCNH